MTRPILRKDDVVRVNAPDSGFHDKEGRITDDDGDDKIVKVGHSTLAYDYKELVLLRRPVRVGDRLKMKGEPAHYWSNTVVRIEPDGRLRFSTEGYEMHQISLDPAPPEKYEHADGTPIDMPQPGYEGVQIETRSGVQTITTKRHGKTAETIRATVQANLPTQEEYARALFESDREVVKFVDRVSDWTMQHPDTPLVENITEFCSDRRTRAMQVAWDRNENGWRTRAENRAVELISALNRVRRSPQDRDPR